VLYFVSFGLTMWWKNQHKSVLTEQQGLWIG